jgi:hypothetical protein
LAGGLLISSHSYFAVAFLSARARIAGISSGIVGGCFARPAGISPGEWRFLSGLVVPLVYGLAARCLPSKLMRGRPLSSCGAN